MAVKAISHIIAEAAKKKKAEDKAQVLRENRSDALTYILELAFHPNVGWWIPEGAPPYKPCEYVDVEGRLYKEADGLQNFLSGNRPELKQSQREHMFIQVLESIHPDDAKLVIDVKDKTVKGIDRDVVNLAFPGLIPNG